MSNVSFGFGSADATNIIQAAKYYGFTLQTGFSVMVVLCCQLLGYGVAGLCSRWLVEPASMIWPGVLSNIALLSSMHSKANAVADGWRISRIKFFMVSGAAAFVWYWFPGLIFTGLSYFTWICWIAPKNVVVNQVFGMVSGMGLFPLSTYFAYVWFLQANPDSCGSFHAIVGKPHVTCTFSDPVGSLRLEYDSLQRESPHPPGFSAVLNYNTNAQGTADKPYVFCS